MSACCRKSSQEKVKEQEEEESHVYKTNKIYFDSYGNLIYDFEDKISFSHEKELRIIAELEPGDAKADGLTWYLMDAP